LAGFILANRSAAAGFMTMPRRICTSSKAPAGHRVAHVVVLARPVVDAIPSATRRTAFEAAKLTGQPRQVEQLHLAAVQQRQRVSVDFPVGLVRQP
jgi:hypothetical protein